MSPIGNQIQGMNKGGLCPVVDEQEGSGNPHSRLTHFFQRGKVYFGSWFCMFQPVIFVFTYWLDRASLWQEQLGGGGGSRNGGQKAEGAKKKSTF